YVDGCPLYNAGSWVNSQLPDNAAVDPNSASMVAKFESQVGVSNGSLTTTGSNTPALRWFGGFDIYVSTSTDTSTWKTVCSREVLNGTSWSWMTDLHN